MILLVGNRKKTSRFVLMSCSSPLLDKSETTELESDSNEISEKNCSNPGAGEPETIMTRQPVQFMAVKSVISTAKSIDVQTAMVS